MPSSDRPVTLRLFEWASVAAFTGTCGALLVQLSSVPWGRLQLITIGVGTLLGYLVADVVSGVVHWFFDTYFHDDTPLIGRAFVHPFREHHVDPLAITRHDFFEVNGNTSLALLPVVIAALLLGNPGDGELGTARFAQTATQTVALAFALATFATNQFHQWAHQERPAAAVRWLQASGLILSPAHHRNHHSGNYRQSFCITAGWLDPLLDRMHFFQRIEHVVRRLSSGGGHGGEIPNDADTARRRMPAAPTSENR